MVIKLDLHKAYDDSVNWSILDTVLDAFGFRRRLLDLIFGG